MRHLRSLLPLCALAALLCVPAASVAYAPSAALADNAAAAPSSLSTALAAEESGLVLAMNQQRAANSVPPLAVDPQLTAIARARSQDQVDQHYFSHTNPQGQTVFDLLDKTNYPWTAAAENLSESAGMDPVQAALDGFSKSPEHRANMLSTDYGHVGVGAAQTADGTTILSVVFTN